jgi:RHS repeat-associated protein
LTDDTGVVKTTYTYDPFGNVTISGEASDNPFQYTGRENDGTGLYYYRARYYSPELQRFISEDPILKFGNPDIPFLLPRLLRTPAILNAYNYVGNSPINFIDPWGLISPTIPGYWKYFRWLAPRDFCILLKQRVEHAEEENKDCKAIGEEPLWEIDPEAYTLLDWCYSLGYLK